MSQRSLLNFFKRPAPADEAAQPPPKRAALAASPSGGAAAQPSGSAAPERAAPERAPERAAPERAPMESTPDATRHAKALKKLGTGVLRKEEAEEKKLKARFAFLERENLRDGKKRPPSHPEFDVRTLYVPDNVKLSPSQQAYWDIKRNYQDTVLFFKVGSFAELYEKDADIGAAELGWKLTLSGVGHCHQVGCPASGVDAAVATLVARGYKVGRVEQLETSAEAKARRGPGALVRRELRAVATPATELSALRSDAVHLLALGEGGGFCVFEAAAGRAYLGAAEEDGLASLLAVVAPAEVLIPRGAPGAAARAALASCACKPAITQLTYGEEFPPAHDEAAVAASLRGAFDPMPAALRDAPPGAAAALGALRAHLIRCRSDAQLLFAAEVLPFSSFSGAALRVDAAALAALEVLNDSAGGVAGSLLKRMDACASAPGRRLLRRWLAAPLRCIAAICARQDAVDELDARSELCASLRASLRTALDLERALGRARAAAAPPAAGLPPDAAKAQRSRRMAALAAGAAAARSARAILTSFAAGNADGRGAPEAALLRQLAAASNLPPAADAALDAALCFDDAPDDEECSALNAHIADFVSHGAAWGALASSLASLDVLSAFAAAAAAADGPTCRPRFVARAEGASATLQLRGLWHPCCANNAAAPVGNDVLLGGDGASTMLLTGPNNGGKSTLLRAVGLAVLLAHAGARVPAASAELSPTDRIFTRVGASDSLSSGQSTFLVEMAETERILSATTPDSLVLADELGRGTATFDGFALASAVLAELANSRARCLFATHYHGLSAQYAAHPAVALRHMACHLRASDEDAGEQDVVFLYQLQSGVAPRSYGLHVAALAGIPRPLVRNAAQRAAALESRLAGAFADAAAAGDGALDAAAAAALREAVAALETGAQPAALQQAWRAAQLAL